jgi:predicted transglutaminase-like cysteine proteinase
MRVSLSQPEPPCSFVQAPPIGCRRFLAASLLVLAAALALVLARPLPAAAQEAARASFFRSQEVRSADLQAFSKWRGALARYAAESEKERGASCEKAVFTRCHYQEWQAFLATIAGKTRWEQLIAVNQYMNTRAYITDPVNWGVSDYWETPGEFMARYGDCEDYAIAKFLSLKQLGWTDEEVRIAAVTDLNLKVGHAVLIASYGGRTWLLDNQIKQVVDTENVRHYQPVFSINETWWWRHRS